MLQGSRPQFVWTIFATLLVGGFTQKTGGEGGIPSPLRVNGLTSFLKNLGGRCQSNPNSLSEFYRALTLLSFDFSHGLPAMAENQRVEGDARRTCQPLEIAILVKMYRKRSMGALISLGEPIDHSLPYNRGILSQHRQKSSKMAILTP